MVVIKGKRIDLIIPTMRHAKQIVEQVNDKDIASFIPAIPHPYRMKDAEFYIKKVAQPECRKKTGYQLSIYHKEDKKVIGGIALSHLDKMNKNVEIGYWIGKDYRRDGYCSEAVKMCLDFAFKKIKLKKVYAKVFPPNKGSQRLLKKFGFKKEGVLRKQSFNQGKLHDDIFYGLLKEEYEKN